MRKIDYRKSVSAKKKLGGGILLELSHEIDYMLWIFGKPNYLRAFIDKNKIFKKDVEEKVNIIFYYSHFTLHLEMSFNSRLEERELIIEATKASLKANLLKNEITINKSNKSKILYKTKQNNMNMLFGQMMFFLNSVEKNQNKNNIQSSIEVVRLISLIRKSNSYNKKIKI